MQKRHSLVTPTSGGIPKCAAARCESYARGIRLRANHSHIAPDPGTDLSVLPGSNARNFAHSRRNGLVLPRKKNNKIFLKTFCLAGSSSLISSLVSGGMVGHFRNQQKGC